MSTLIGIQNRSELHDFSFFAETRRIIDLPTFLDWIQFRNGFTFALFAT